MQPIYYDGHPVVMADKHRFWLTHSIELLPDGHPTKRLVLLMCSFARDVLAGELPGPYSDARAEQFAREALVPADEIRARPEEQNIDLALNLRVPVREVVARREELEPDS